MTSHYDLCIIGTGSGNSVLNEDYEDFSVAMVERDVFGGTCLNKGCIPSKMLIYPADLIQSVEHAKRLGVDLTVEGAHWQDVRDRTFDRIDSIALGGHKYRQQMTGVDVYDGDARFVAPKTLEIDRHQITAERFVLAAGAHSHLPSVEGLNEVGFHTSDSIMRVDDVPARLLIIGGGFIAAELGHVFDAFGSAVTVVARGPKLLRAEDELMSDRITSRLASRFSLYLDSTPYKVERIGDEIVASVRTPQGEVTISCDEILVATGRTPNGKQLNVEATGVRLDANGYVMTDPTCLTDAEGIWALGDIRNPEQLKHLANQEARVVSHNIIHPEDPISINQRVIPHAVFTYPQIGAVGMTEAEAKRNGYDIAVGTQDYAGTAYGWAMEDNDGIAKIIADRSTRQVLGAHVYGPQASILIQQVVQGMQFGQNVDDMAGGVIYPHPALSEVIENALLNTVEALSH